MTNQELATLFFLQSACLLALCRVVGLVAARVRQPQVVAEIVAGILLGPSLLGWLWPSAQTALFPREAMTVIYVVAQVGLALYMFLVGMEFQVALVVRKIRSALSISVAGIIVPLALGAGLALVLRQDSSYFRPDVSAGQAALYLGAAMAITAFPVLARIITERGIAGTSLGTLALAAGATGDAAAWSLLAIVLASFDRDISIALWAIGGGIVYAVFMFSLGRRWFARLADAVARAGSMSGMMLSGVLTIVCVGAWFTDMVGIYSVFGAFILGAVMPRGLFAEELQRRLGPLTTTFLLPLFFVYSGLNTRIGLLNAPALIFIALGICAIASVGKGVACWAAARISGHSQRDALAIGSLMNARGLMELIILNIGLERGLITPLLFTMMVIMAIVTTFAAGPLFEFFYRRDGHAVI